MSMAVTAIMGMIMRARWGRTPILTSVGIDIGSSTSHLMFSQLLIGYPSVLQRKPLVLERNVIARSPILLTPFSGDWNIEAGPLRELIEETFAAAGLGRNDIDTGAVIITGEAARRETRRRSPSCSPMKPVSSSAPPRDRRWKPSWRPMVRGRCSRAAIRG